MRQEQREWDALRSLLASETEQMAWRLSPLTADDIDNFLTELTDRICSKVCLRD